MNFRRARRIVPAVCVGLILIGRLAGAEEGPVIPGVASAGGSTHDQPRATSPKPSLRELAPKVRDWAGTAAERITGTGAKPRQGSLDSSANQGGAVGVQSERGSTSSKAYRSPYDARSSSGKAPADRGSVAPGNQFAPRARSDAARVAAPANGIWSVESARDRGGSASSKMQPTQKTPSMPPRPANGQLRPSNSTRQPPYSPGSSVR
jgi:hypothetical protein